MRRSVKADEASPGLGLRVMITSADCISHSDCDRPQPFLLYTEAMFMPGKITSENSHHKKSTSRLISCIFMFVSFYLHYVVLVDIKFRF